MSNKDDYEVGYKKPPAHIPTLKNSFTSMRPNTRWSRL